MGAEQSAEADKRQRESENEAFNTVVVSEDVVRRLTGAGDRGGGSGTSSKQDKTEAGAKSDYQEKRSASSASTTTAGSRIPPSDSERSQLAYELEKQTTKLDSGPGSDHQNQQQSHSATGGARPNEQHHSPTSPNTTTSYNDQLMSDLQDRERALQKLMTGKLDEKSASVSAKVAPSQPNSSTCSAEQQQVLKCYTEHARQSLLCAEHVKHFEQCVNQTRMDMLTTTTH